MQKLNLPEYDLQIRREGDRTLIFDPFRGRYLVMTPEELVRQTFARYLISEKGFPASLMATEYALTLNNLSKRCDILVFARSGKPVLLVECKAPAVKITQETFDQAARYNMVFQVSYLLVTNGMKHYACYVDHREQRVEFLKEIPGYEIVSGE